MRQRVLRLVPLVALAVACSTQAPDASREHTGSAASPIINGVVDTTHTAVVAVVSVAAGKGCSGTIVKVDVQRHVGWVATAAHCVSPNAPTDVIQGDDVSAAEAIRYPILDSTAHPQYVAASGKIPATADFGMVRITGVGVTTPVIPLTDSPDHVAVGTQVTSVGYGSTTPDGGFQVVRHSVAKTLDDVSASYIGYDQSTSGVCSGDSGGPTLTGAAGSERVVGIQSFVTLSCTGRGYAARVQDGRDFFLSEMAKELPDDSCSFCGTAVNSGVAICAVVTKSCNNDRDCLAINRCKWKSSLDDCANQFPLGEGPYLAMKNCTCNRGCTSECSGDASCTGVATCGFANEAGACASCVESSCCQEELDCAADGQCYVCLKGKDADPSCATNDKRKALANCAATKCQSQCAGNSLETGADPADAGTDAGTGAPPADTVGCSTTARRGSSGMGAAAALLALVLAGVRRRRRA